MADKPVDAEDALADLRFGKQYFDRWFTQNLPKQKEEAFNQVLKYTEQARKKDPSVTLQVKSEKGEVEQVTPDSLAAAIHLAHGSYEASNGDTGAERLRGREHLHKSIAIHPTPAAFVDLARAYISENDRANALTITKAGQQQFPDNFEIRKAMDMMTSDEKLGAKPSNRRGLFFVLSVLLIFGGFVIYAVADALRGAQSMSKAVVVTACACWMLGVICFLPCTKTAATGIVIGTRFGKAYRGLCHIRRERLLPGRKIEINL